MAFKKILGKEVKVYAQALAAGSAAPAVDDVNWKLVGCAQSASLSRTKEQTDVAPLCLGEAEADMWIDKVSGNKGWGLSLDGIVGYDVAEFSMDDFEENWLGSEDLYIKIVYERGADIVTRHGCVSISGLDDSIGGVTELVTYSVSLDGRAALNKVVTVA